MVSYIYLHIFFFPLLFAGWYKIQHILEDFFYSWVKDFFYLACEYDVMYCHNESNTNRKAYTLLWGVSDRFLWKWNEFYKKIRSFEINFTESRSRSLQHLPTTCCFGFPFWQYLTTIWLLHWYIWFFTLSSFANRLLTCTLQKFPVCQRVRNF